MKSARPELSNDMSHDAESKLCQKLLTRNNFPRRQLINYILGTIDGRTWKKCFFDPTFKEQSIVIYS